MEIAEFIFSVIASLVAGIIHSRTAVLQLSYFKQRRIKNKIDNALTIITEPFIPFFEKEGIPEEKQKLLMEICKRELKVVTENPEEWFKGSLDGKKIFNRKYPEGNLPRDIVDEGLEAVYSLLFPRIAEILYKIPVVIQEWETEAWRENYSRLDEIANNFNDLFQKIDGMITGKQREQDRVFYLIRRTLAQDIGFNMDITGLRSDAPQSGLFEHYYVHPALSRQTDNDKITIDKDDVCFNEFSAKGCLSIVTGAPGSGKTTWATWLQREALNRNIDLFPVRINLRNYVAKELTSLHDTIRDAAGIHFKDDLSGDLLRTWMSKKQILFIFDGFDELPPQERDRFWEWINGIYTASGQCPCIITSRPLTSGHLDKPDNQKHKWDIEAFDENRITQYIKQWYEHSPLLQETDRTIDARSLVNDWLQDPTISPLTGNPLLLSTLLMVHHLDGELPSGRSQLYDRYVQGMIGLWDSRRKVKAVDITLTIDQRYQILRDIALKKHLVNKDALDDHEITAIVQETLQELNIDIPVDHVLSCLLERTGLIVGPGTWGFIHNTIAEYLIAVTIHQGDKRDVHGNRIDRLYLLDRHLDDRWNAVTFLLAGLTPVADLEDFIQRCLEKDDWSLGYGLLLDQYYRVTKELRRELMLGFINKLNKLVKEKDPSHRLLNPISLLPIDYLIPGSDKLAKYPFRELRGLTFKIDLQLFYKANYNKDLSIDDMRKLNKNPFYFLLLMLYSTNPDIAIITKVINILQKDTNDIILVFIYLYLLLFYTRDKKVLSDAIKFIDTTYPNYGNIWKIIYLSFALENTGSQFVENYISFPIDSVPDFWLISTKNWIKSRKPIDILITFKEDLHERHKSKVIPPDLYKKALADTEALIERRDKLEKAGNNENIK